jgi:hypothetical protein
MICTYTYIERETDVYYKVDRCILQSCVQTHNTLPVTPDQISAVNDRTPMLHRQAP